jgi:hypothetical protein
MLASNLGTAGMKLACRNGKLDLAFAKLRANIEASGARRPNSYRAAAFFRLM